MPTHILRMHLQSEYVSKLSLFNTYVQHETSLALFRAEIDRVECECQQREIEKENYRHSQDKIAEMETEFASAEQI